MDKNALLYYQSANALKLFPKAIECVQGFEIIYGKRRYFFRGGETPFNCGSSLSIAKNKYCMNKVLEAAGLPVPKAISFSLEEFTQTNIKDLLKGLSFPLVIKPTNDTQLGLDVICNIQTVTQLQTQLLERFQRHKFLSVEEFHPDLNAYRVLVFQHKVIGVVQRFPACVVGDGVHSIRELIALQNIEREKFKKTVALGPIVVDEEYKIRLKELNITLATIPEDKEKIVLCYTCNSTRGGTMQSLGKQICPENARLLCHASRALDLNLVGFDVVCEDIMLPMKKSRGVIIEANHHPDITIHENPMFGLNNQVSKRILRQLIFRYPLSYLYNVCKQSSAVYRRGCITVVIFIIGKLLFLQR